MSDLALAHQFDDLEQQNEASTMGMWIFLVTEVLFFGGMFVAYAVYRSLYPEAFASTSRFMNLPLGAINTAVLLTSSLTMALAVQAAQLGQRKAILIFLSLTILLGLAFLGVKAYEYHEKFVEHLIPGNGFEYDARYHRQAQLLFTLYFAMTGIHALHMIIGIGIILFVMFMAWQNRFSPEYHSPVELTGLYWHFVDVIWIFLFPLLYLIGQHR